jgi:hypothetical protein
MLVAENSGHFCAAMHHSAAVPLDTFEGFFVVQSVTFEISVRPNHARELLYDAVILFTQVNCLFF